MTIQEAIERLEVHKGWGYREGTMTALDMAISALKEIQQYRGNGTVEECREAVEKQKAQARNESVVGKIPISGKKVRENNGCD